MTRNNKKNKNVSPPLYSCSTQTAPDCNPSNEQMVCSPQCSACCNNNSCTANNCEPLNKNTREEQELCPMVKSRIQKSQQKILSCSEICERGPSHTTSIEKCTSIHSVMGRDPICEACFSANLTSNAAPVSPQVSKLCRKCCSTKEHQNQPNEDQNQPPCDKSNCPILPVLSQGNVPEESQELHEDKKTRMRPMPPFASSPSKTSHICIASEISQTLQATLPNKKENEKKVKKNKKLKGSKTSLKSNKSVVSDSCSCKENEEGCACHFPPAFSEFFNCTGDITGTCMCTENKKQP